MSRKTYPVKFADVGDGNTITNEGVVTNSRGKILSQRHLHASKGKYVRIKIDGKFREMSVHKLVAEAFVPNPDECGYVIHLDMDYDNNHADNLKWCFMKEYLDYTHPRS